MSRLSQLIGTERQKTDGLNSIFNVVGKQKRRMESRIPMTWVMEKQDYPVFLFHRKMVGTKVQALISYVKDFSELLYI